MSKPFRKYHILREVWPYPKGDAVNIAYLCGREEIAIHDHEWLPKYHQGICKRCERIAKQ